MVDFQSRDTRRGVRDDAEKSAEPTESAAGYAVISVAPEPSLEDDPAGDAVVSAIKSAGGRVATREAIRPTYDGVQSVVGSITDRKDVRVAVTIGGTGVEPDDVTVDAVEPLIDKRLPGFGEVFRMGGYDEVGAKVIGTRAMAGLVDAVPVFCLPGDAAAARRGMSTLVVDQADRLASLASGDD